MRPAGADPAAWSSLYAQQGYFRPSPAVDRQSACRAPQRQQLAALPAIRPYAPCMYPGPSQHHQSPSQRPRHLVRAFVIQPL
eukprot:5713697-Prorocentrum_lima.AAC.1